ncbi:MAG: DNA-processing protein DprA [Candidatus Omnitrophota bacterium]
MAIRRIERDSKDYPVNLNSISGAPKELFVNGNILACDENAVAIVGTRTPTHYGIEQCEKLSYDLAMMGITIISGMARGIDSCAHRAALKAGGRTIAILGSGHNHIYPPENRKLYEEIVSRAAVISEFPSDTRPFKANFPRRNRIISGLSKGVIVVEAAARSGTLITVDFALEQGREVFAVPGNVSSPKSSGTNLLIKEGARLVQDASDITDELKNVLDVKGASDETGYASRPAPEASLSELERAVFEATGQIPKSIDEISAIANLPVHRTSDSLLKLELKRLVKALPGENYIKCQ